jgi:hypothetical protein
MKNSYNCSLRYNLKDYYCVYAILSHHLFAKMGSVVVVETFLEIRVTTYFYLGL